MDALFSKFTLVEVQEELLRRVCPNFQPNTGRGLAPIQHPADTSGDESSLPIKQIDEDAELERIVNHAAPRRSRTVVSTDGLNVYQGKVEAMSTASALSISNRVKEILHLFKNISCESDSESAMLKTVLETASFLQCDRVCIYLLEDNGDLMLSATNGKAVERILLGQSITGEVARTGVSMIVNNVDDCPLFDASQDEQSGYKTRSMLVAPILDNNGTCFAVLQAVNKLPEGTAFSHMDEGLLFSMAAIAGMALEKISTSARHFMESLDEMVNVFESISHESDPEKALYQVIEQTADFLKSDRVSIYVVEANGDLTLKATNGKAVALIPLGTSITGEVARTGRTMVVNRVDECALFDASQDKDSGYNTHSMLVTPILDDTGTVIAVLQVVNKQPHGAVFTVLDESLVSNIAAIGGMTLRRCQITQDSITNSLKQMVGVFQKVSVETDPEKAMVQIVKQTATLLSSDRVCFYVVDGKALVLKATNGNAVSSVAANRKSITAEVAGTGISMVVNDVDKCAFFDKSQDEASGYCTRSMMVVPAFDAQGKILAVLQVVNKLPYGATFTERDETIVSNVAAVAAMTLRNCDLLQDCKRCKRRASGLHVSTVGQRSPSGFSRFDLARARSLQDVGSRARSLDLAR